MSRTESLPPPVVRPNRRQGFARDARTADGFHEALVLLADGHGSVVRNLSALTGLTTDGVKSRVKRAKQNLPRPTCVPGAERFDRALRRLALRKGSVVANLATVTGLSRADVSARVALTRADAVAQPVSPPPTGPGAGMRPRWGTVRMALAENGLSPWVARKIIGAGRVRSRKLAGARYPLIDLDGFSAALRESVSTRS